MNDDAPFRSLFPFALLLWASPAAHTRRPFSRRRRRHSFESVCQIICEQRSVASVESGGAEKQLRKNVFVALPLAVQQGRLYCPYMRSKLHS